jgi:hypothetical protein
VAFESAFLFARAIRARSPSEVGGSAWAEVSAGGVGCAGAGGGGVFCVGCWLLGGGFCPQIEGESARTSQAATIMHTSFRIRLHPLEKAQVRFSSLDGGVAATNGTGGLPVFKSTSFSRQAKDLVTRGPRSVPRGKRNRKSPRVGSNSFRHERDAKDEHLRSVKSTAVAGEQNFK